LQLIEELKSSMIDSFDIVSSDGTIVLDDLFDERELLERSNELKQNKVKLLSRREVFDGNGGSNIFENLMPKKWAS